MLKQCFKRWGEKASYFSSKKKNQNLKIFDIEPSCPPQHPPLIFIKLITCGDETDKKHPTHSFYPVLAGEGRGLPSGQYAFSLAFLCSLFPPSQPRELASVSSLTIKPPFSIQRRVQLTSQHGAPPCLPPL